MWKEYIKSIIIIGIFDMKFVSQSFAEPLYQACKRETEREGEMEK